MTTFNNLSKKTHSESMYVWSSKNEDKIELSHIIEEAQLINFLQTENEHYMK